jgi:nucleotide-binding universal stress UspA family protein
MTILCCTDFSDGARRALGAAAALARARRTSVRLVHAFDTPGAREVLAERAEARVTQYFEDEERRLLAGLEHEAATVRDVARVECQVLAGRAAEAILEHVAASAPELVVVAAVGVRGGGLLRLGSTADRLVQRASAPVLVVRDDEPFRAWTAGARPLRVVCALDLSPTSDAALRWTATLRSAGPCAMSGVHVYWPPEVRARFHQRGLPIGESPPEVAAALEAELRAQVAAVAPDLAAMPVQLVGGLGRVAQHLSETAAAERADLLVVGTHQRQGLDRLWRGSVSRDAIVGTPLNLAAVPV